MSEAPMTWFNVLCRAIGDAALFLSGLGFVATCAYWTSRLIAGWL